MTVFESMQCQQTVKGVLPYTEVESERYVSEQWTILKALREHADMRQSIKGYPSPVSLKESRSLVLLPELYDALYSPRSMATPAHPSGSPWKGTCGRGDGSSILNSPFCDASSRSGGTAAMLRMDCRVASFAETQEGSATDWESEMEGAAVPVMGTQPGGMSDEEWEGKTSIWGITPPPLPLTCPLLWRTRE